MYGLGRMYEYGNGVKQDYTKAFGLYKKAVAANYMNAALEVGYFYANGFGVDRDYSKALRSYAAAPWHEKAILRKWVALGMSGRTSEAMALAKKYSGYATRKQWSLGGLRPDIGQDSFFQMIQYLGNKISADELINLSKMVEDEIYRLHLLASVHYYIGAAYMVKKDKANAIKAFKACIETGVGGSSEYQCAKNNIKQLQSIGGMELLHQSVAIVKPSPEQATLLTQELADFSKKMTADDLPLIKDWIQHGASVNGTDEDGMTPLIYASRKNLVDIAKLLIENKANVNVKSKYNETALYCAVISAKSFAGTTDIELTKLLLDNKADVAIAASVSFPILIQATFNGKKDIVKLLIAYKADLNVVDFQGKTALIRAISANPEIAEVLLKAGADVNIKDNEGISALSIATKYKNKESITMLKDYGAK